jgi:tellurite resistance protein
MGVEFLPVSFLFFYFAVGAFFWVVLFTLFLNRVIFHHQMPQKFIPTLFILIAPPAVGFISYFKLTQQWDMVGEFLLSITYFFVLLLIFLARSFKNLKFFVSWWAFIFPLDALTIASVLAYKVSEQPFYKYATWAGLAVTLVFVGIVGYQTILKIKAGEICVKEEE